MGASWDISLRWRKSLPLWKGGEGVSFPFDREFHSKGEGPAIFDVLLGQYYEERFEGLSLLDG